MAQAGGIGVIHKNLDIERQAAEVRRVKRFESGMVVDPITIPPERPLQDALELMDRNSISGIPVISKRGGKLVGILTNPRRSVCHEPGTADPRVNDKAQTGNGERRGQP